MELLVDDVQIDQWEDRGPKQRVDIKEGVG
jgi:hypothetical protein